MPVPKRRITHSRKKTRSANKHYDQIGLSICPNCQKPKMPHRVCENCGYYKGKNVLRVEES